MSAVSSATHGAPVGLRPAAHLHRAAHARRARSSPHRAAARSCWCRRADRSPAAAAGRGAPRRAAAAPRGSARGRAPARSRRRRCGSPRPPGRAARSEPPAARSRQRAGSGVASQTRTPAIQLSSVSESGPGGGCGRSYAQPNATRAATRHGEYEQRVRSRTPCSYGRPRGRAGSTSSRTMRTPSRRPWPRGILPGLAARIELPGERPSSQRPDGGSPGAGRTSGSSSRSGSASTSSTSSPAGWPTTAAPRRRSPTAAGSSSASATSTR